MTILTSRLVGPRIATLAALAALTMVLALAGGCGTDSSAQPAGSATNPSKDTLAAVTMRDPWVKAADSGMTAAFGTLINGGDTDITIVSVTSPVSPVEIHEMVMRDGEMVMQAKEGGLTVGAGRTHALEPGGDHLMLMELAEPIRPGDEVTFTLTLSDGRTLEFSAVAKPFAGANESYHPQEHSAS